MPNQRDIVSNTKYETLLDLERAVLGCVIARHKQCLPMVTNILQPNDFYGTLHKKIFEVMLFLDAGGFELDAITVSAELVNRGEAPCASFLSDCADYAICAHAETYSLQVKEFSKCRQIADVIITAREALAEGKQKSEDIINTFSDAFLSIQNEKVKEFVALKDLIGPVYEEVKNGATEGLLTGFSKLDAALKGFKPETLNFIASGAGKGKTSLAMNLAVQFISKGYIGALFSLEMSDIELVKRFLAIVSETDSNRTNAELEQWGSADAIKDRFAAAGLISTYGLSINDHGQDIKSLTSSAKAFAMDLKRKKEKLDFIMVDYLQLLDPTNDDDIREQQVSKMSKGLKRLCRDLEIPIFAVAQTNRLAEKEKKRDYKLFDLRESGAIEQDADSVMFLNDVDPEKQPDKYKLDLAKNRHGPGGFQFLRFQKDINKFFEVDENENPI